jgi:2-polyprenyl-3-methyl-5-hydroxy-6-metoxy-1,4-benzoquinol methylase
MIAAAMDRHRSKKSVENLMVERLSLCSEDVNPRKVRLIDEYIIPGAVLDVGCGNGLYAVPLAEQGHDVLQVDLVDRRSQYALHLPFQQGDAERLVELKLGTFQNVLAFDVIEHLDDDASFLRTVRDLCSGRLLLSVPNSDDSCLLRVGVTHMHRIDRTHRREYSPESLKSLLAECGWRVKFLGPQLNELLPYFARVLARPNLMSKVASRVISLQCLALLRLGIFENNNTADWFCVAEPE